MTTFRLSMMICRLGSLQAASTASARPSFPSRVPNGTGNSGSTCHKMPPMLNPVGAASTNLEVVPLNDATPEAAETVLLQFSAPPVGSYTLTAKATDSLGASTVSAPIHIQIIPPTRYNIHRAD